MLLHPSGRWALVLCELNATLLCYPWDGVIASASHAERQQASGVLASTPTTVLDLLPASYRQRHSPETLHQHNISSALRLHPLRADRLYASNRGHDSVAVIEFFDLDGSMRVLQWVASGGRTPRDIALDPQGEWLFVANQDSDQVAVFAVDPGSGLIRDSSTSPAATDEINDTHRSTSLTTLEKATPDSTSDVSGREPLETATALQLKPRQVLSICEPCTVFVEEIPPPPPTRRLNECQGKSLTRHA
ncbi:hypothetical protein F1559_005072 [Cyanidiococcus yangmingshanensis]|uniref:6-phosphogluconolactonase n=1 Tax=Cyanidiococcus yangmingshanensis TaxID=2690220 RepID=A0A7J7IR16_9RHOD|nr:hypothetical protein F1559_005072 [Cyanidiococcus yangmingshanensis]